MFRLSTTHLSESYRNGANPNAGRFDETRGVVLFPKRWGRLPSHFPSRQVVYSIIRFPLQVLCQDIFNIFINPCDNSSYAPSNLTASSWYLVPSTLETAVTPRPGAAPRSPYLDSHARVPYRAGKIPEPKHNNKGSHINLSPLLPWKIRLSTFHPMLLFTYLHMC